MLIYMTTALFMNTRTPLSSRNRVREMSLVRAAAIETKGLDVLPKDFLYLALFVLYGQKNIPISTSTYTQTKHKKQTIE